VGTIVEKRGVSIAGFAIERVDGMIERGCRGFDNRAPCLPRASYAASS
jgi:hypothetical protein